MKQTYLYFIGYEPSDCKRHTDELGRFPIKVGIAEDIERRLTGLQIASPYRLVLYARCNMIGNESTSGLEKRVHDMLSEARMRREWFLLSKDDLGRVVEELSALPWFEECLLVAIDGICPRCGIVCCK